MFLNLRRYYGKRFSRFVLWRGFDVYDELRGGGDGSNASSQPTVKSKADKPAGKDLGEKPKSNNDKNAGGVSGGLEESDDGFSNSGAGGSSSGNQNDNGSNSSGSTGNTGSGNSGSNGGSQGGSTGGSTNPSTKPQNNSLKIIFDVAQGASVATNKSFVITVNQDLRQDGLDQAILFYKKNGYSNFEYLPVEIKYADKKITVTPKQTLAVNSKYVLKVKALGLVALSGARNQTEKAVGFNTNVAVTDCDGGFSLQDKNGNKCYKFFNGDDDKDGNNKLKKYEDAEKKCEELKSTLVEKETIKDWLERNDYVDGGNSAVTGSIRVTIFEKLGGKYKTEYWIGGKQILVKRESNVPTDFSSATNTDTLKAFICYKDKIVPEVVGSGKFDGEKTVTFKFNKDLKGFAANSNVVLKNGQNSSGVTSATFKQETKTLTVELASVESGKQYTLTLNPNTSAENGKITDYYGNVLEKVDFTFGKAASDQCSTLGGAKVGNSCYFKGEKRMYWSNADAYCKGKSAKLLSVEDGGNLSQIAQAFNLDKIDTEWHEPVKYWLQEEVTVFGSTKYRYFSWGGSKWVVGLGRHDGISGTYREYPFVCKLN